MTDPILPPSLAPGDRVGIVAPSGRVEEAKVKQAVQQFKKWGLEAVEGKHLYDQYDLYAGRDADRLADLQGFINDPDIRAVFCARGGYGTLRLVSRLDLSALKDHPKWISGYSDITVLHAALNQQGLASLHAPMSANFAGAQRREDTLEHFREALFGQGLAYDCSAHPNNRTGKSKALITGGNLSVMLSLSGTPYDIDTTDKILFLEEIGEYDYHLDRMMMNLKLSGKLSQLKGLIAGQLSGMKKGRFPISQSPEAIIYEHVKAYDYPVCFGFPAGHEEPNYTLVMGQWAEMEVGKKGVELKQSTI